MCTSSGVSSSSRRKAFHENMMQKQIRRTQSERAGEECAQMLCWQPREIGLTTYVPLACDSGIRTARPSPMIDKIDKWCGQNALKQMVVKYRDDRTIEWQNAKDFGGAVRQRCRLQFEFLTPRWHKSSFFVQLYLVLCLWTDHIVATYHLSNANGQSGWWCDVVTHLLAEGDAMRRETHGVGALCRQTAAPLSQIVIVDCGLAGWLNDSPKRWGR